MTTLDADVVIDQLAHGKLLRQIAAEHGVNKTSIYRRVKDHPEYAQAIVSQAESLVEQAIDEVMTCDADTCNIARARVDAAFKWAAARDPARWATKSQISVTIEDISAHLAAARERLVAGERVVAEQQPGNVAVQSLPISADTDTQSP